MNEKTVHRIYSIAASLAFCLAYGNYLFGPELGQFLTSVVQPQSTQMNEIGHMSDFGYDTARDIVRFMTAVSCTLVFFYRRDKTKKMGALLTTAELIALIAIPFLVQVEGHLIIDSWGGMGAE
jgi:hypothetical protein